jgi:hypothetical protein
LGAENIIARLDDEAVKTLRRLIATGATCQVQQPLEPFRKSHPKVFTTYRAFNTDTFRIPSGDGIVFPALKKSTRPWMTRQSVWNAVHRARTVMHAFTGQRRYNPSTRFNGSHVSVHGATRHTGAALLLFNDASPILPPTEATIMEVQQRCDANTFKRHYFHAHESQIKDALEYAAVPIYLGHSGHDVAVARTKLVTTPGQGTVAHADQQSVQTVEG